MSASDPHALLSCSVLQLSELLQSEEMLISFLNTFLALPLFPRRLRYSASLGMCGEAEHIREKGVLREGMSTRRKKR